MIICKYIFMHRRIFWACLRQAVALTLAFLISDCERLLVHMVCWRLAVIDEIDRTNGSRPNE